MLGFEVMSTDQILLILYGAPSGPIRRVVHIGEQRDGAIVPRCNSHYTAQQDIGPRRFRAAEGDELEYPICQRCQHVRTRGSAKKGYPSETAAMEANPGARVYLCSLCSKWHAS